MINSADLVRQSNPHDSVDHANEDIESLKKRIPVRDVMQIHCVTATPEENPAVVAQRMKDKGVTCVVVVEAQQVVGVLTQMNLLRQLSDKGHGISDGTVGDCMSNSVLSVYPHQTLWDATELMEQHHVKRLPVIEEGRLVGIVTQTDLIRALFACGSFKEVNAIMVRDVATLTPQASVVKAIETMAQQGLSCLVVIEGERPIGMVTERDILELIATQQNPETLQVQDIMTSPLITIDSRYSVHSAACLMDQKHIHRLVIEDDGVLKGVITRTDIFVAALKNLEMEKAMAAAYQEIKKVESQLIQNEKLASIGQMAAGVAHEMNTPVGFVSSNFQTLRKYMDHFLELFKMYEELGSAVEDGAKERRLEILQGIHATRNRMKIEFILDDIGQLFDDSQEGLERVTAIVQNLRNFSRVDQVDAVSEYDMNQGIESSLMVARNAIKYDADVELDLGSVPVIQGNGGQINQVILNICVNAAQAIKGQEREDRGTIKLRTFVDGDFVVCEIKDDGPGIAPEHLKKVFDPFYTTKPVGVGTGLGLSVSHDIIVNKHKGQLLVATEMGQGTTFTIKLPLQNDVAPVESILVENVC